MEAADASFRTCIDPISPGFTQFRYESRVGVPSMMYSGSLFWNELTPRILTVLREPGEPLQHTGRGLLVDAQEIDGGNGACNVLPSLCRVTGNDHLRQHGHGGFHGDIECRPPVNADP